MPGLVQGATLQSSLLLSSLQTGFSKSCANRNIWSLVKFASFYQNTKHCSMKHKVLFIDRPHEVLYQSLAEQGFEIDEDFQSDARQISRRLGNYTGLVLRSRISIDSEFLENAVNLRFIAREGVGLEHIDLEACKAKGIEVLYSPEGSRDTVAEHALGMLLCLMNKLNRADYQVRQRQWNREPNRGVELKGKTVGILGYGNMGSAFAQRLKGFEVEVIAYDKYKTGYADENAREVGLEELFARSEVLSLHIPYMTANHYFVNGEFLDRFAKPIYLVNTARGLVLNTADLVERLKSGKVLGAALDVLEYEESSFDKFKLEELPEDFNYLCKADNVVLTPHIAGWSFESKRKHSEVLAEKIRALQIQ